MNASNPVPAIEAIDVTKRYGKLVAVDRLNLKVPAGSVLVCWGLTAPERPP
jgi:ABC-type multidrug transport system ATPase subunit